MKRLRQFFTKPPAATFCAAPPAASGTVIAGVPYDLGNGVGAGTRGAPARLRAVAAELGLLTAGVAADLGDLRFTYGEDPESILTRLGGAAAELFAGPLRPLFVGGDHSISLPIVDRLARRQELAILWLDAHTDFSLPNPATVGDHKEVLRRISRLPGIRRIVHAGYRGYTLGDETRLGDTVRVLTTAALRRHGPAAVLAALPEELACYVSIDIDILDPAFAPGTSTPVPGGLTLHELEDLLSTVLRRRRVLGTDLVEINPACDIGDRTAHVGCQLLAVVAGS